MYHWCKPNRKPESLFPNASSDKVGSRKFKSEDSDLHGISEFLVFEFFITDFKNFLFEITFPSHELREIFNVLET